jgi:hypothetical protein
MVRIFRAIVVATALAVVGCSGGAPNHGKVAAVSPGQFRTIPAGYNPSVSGWPGAVGDIIQNAGSLSAWTRFGVNNTDWQAFPGSGGGSSYTAGTGIAIDGGVIAATSGFAAHMNLSQANSASAPISTLDLQNNYTVNTAGSETVNWQATFPVGGVQVVGDLFAVNMAGKQSTTTSGSTPTATLPARCDQYTINVGANATTLTIAGLHSDIDGGYIIDYAITPVAGTEIDMQVNGDNTGSVTGQFCGATCTSYVPGHLTISDTSIIQYVGHVEIRNVAPGANKGFYSRFKGSLAEWYVGYTTVTADITTMAIPNVATGSKVTVQRMRPVAN